MGARERAILEAIRTRSRASGAVRVGIGDDAAVLALRPDDELVVTTDLSLEDVHFRRAWHPPEAVGRKCLARGLSDVAAMGARPLAAFLSLAVPKDMTQHRGAAKSWVDRFYDGLLSLADECAVPLAGGDLAQSPLQASADIVVLGSVERGRALLRSGARPGDLLYCTGTLGGAAAELRALTASPRHFRNVANAPLEHPHFFPQPRLAVGQALVRRRLATAAIDISDGLSVDLEHLCTESGLRAEVEQSLLPVATGATLDDALHGGDDYEVLFTAPEPAVIPRRIAGVPVNRIGRMLRTSRSKPAITIVQSDGTQAALAVKGWEHF